MPTCGECGRRICDCPPDPEDDSEDEDRYADPLPFVEALRKS